MDEFSKNLDISSAKYNKEFQSNHWLFNNKKKLIEQLNICNNWWSEVKKKYQENFKLIIDNG